MKPYYTDDWLTLYGGDCREVLASLPADSVDCVVTSPPYWGLRDYGTEGQLGLERTPEEYVANVVAVFREVRRVLKPSGTCWLNLGSSFVNQPTSWGLKPKDDALIPHRVAMALQEPYYTGTIRNEKDRIWLAAMLDAEGCLFIHKRKVGQHNGQGYYRKNDNYGPGVEISNTNLAVVERIMELVGKGSISSQGPEENHRRKQRIYRWNLRTTESRDFVRELYPHLVAKQHQARLLIGCPSNGPDAEKAHASLIALHRGEAATIDFPEPSALFEPGWYVRSDIIWAKKNCMPESVTDRPTKSHEYLFLLTKSARYYFDADAVREPSLPSSIERMKNGWNGDEDRDYAGGKQNHLSKYIGTERGMEQALAGRNIRSVWNIATRPYPGAHFAVFPPELPERCIKAGSSEKGVCPECGAPWERVVERKATTSDGRGRPSPSNGDAHAATDHPRLLGALAYEVTTTGWRPTCTHDPAEGCQDKACPLLEKGVWGHPLSAHGSWGVSDGQPVPAVILDPFGGSGTVGMVANRLSRRAILIDLNPEYLKQQMTRNSQVPLGLTEGDAA